MDEQIPIFSKDTLKRSNTLVSEIFDENEFFRSSSIRNSIEVTGFFQKIEFRSRKKFKKSDFEIKGLIGRGAFAIVVKAELKETNEIFAIKIITKDYLEKEGRLYQIYSEVEILHRIGHSNIIQIIGAFEDENKVYIVVEYCENGNLMEFIKNNNPIPYETARHIIGELIDTLDYLHCMRIAHLDLKPENILLDKNLNIRLIDFATSKIIGKSFDKKKMKFQGEESFSDIRPKNDSDDKSNQDTEDGSSRPSIMRRISLKKGTFVGTAEYVSPEMLEGLPTGIEADLWALGCIVYRMFAQHSPFDDKTEFLVYNKILDLDYKIVSSIPEDAGDFIKSLLVLDPKKRLGVVNDDCDYSLIKNHRFMKNIDFNSLNYLQIPNFSLLKTQAFFKENKCITKNRESSVISMKIKNENIKLVKEGFLKKKSPWFHYNRRKVLLFSHKLQYIDAEKDLVKGEIFFNNECKAIAISDVRFELQTPKRIYCFKSVNNEPILEWVKSITEIIEKINV